MTCPYCFAAVADLSEHFGSDDCPRIVAAFGYLDGAGDGAEDGESAGVMRGQRAVVCQTCGEPAFKEAYCETHLREYHRERSRAYYLDHKAHVKDGIRDRRSAGRIRAAVEANEKSGA